MSTCNKADFLSIHEELRVEKFPVHLFIFWTKLLLFINWLNIGRLYTKFKVIEDFEFNYYILY